jgi:hypothetical protein
LSLFIFIEISFPNAKNTLNWLTVNVDWRWGGRGLSLGAEKLGARKMLAVGAAEFPASNAHDVRLSKV